MAGFEPAVFGSEVQRLIYQAARPLHNYCLMNNICHQGANTMHDTVFRARSMQAFRFQLELIRIKEGEKWLSPCKLHFEFFYAENQ